MTVLSVSWKAMNIKNMNTPTPLWYDLDSVNAAPIAAHPTIDGMIVIGPIRGSPNSEWFTTAELNSENATIEKNALCTE